MSEQPYNWSLFHTVLEQEVKEDSYWNRYWKENMFVYIFAVAILCTAAHGEEDLNTRYRFQHVLDDEGLYVLHWSFDLEAGTIAFAVNVSTTGWVGFGLSPNGQMPLSDVVIGWVDDQGETQFQVSFNKIS